MHNNYGVKQRFLAFFLKILDKNVKNGENYSLISTRYYLTYKYAPNLESLLTQHYVFVNVHSDLIIHAFLLVFIA
jgi:hypothetical protein